LSTTTELKIQYQRDKTYSRDIWNYKIGDYQGLQTALGQVAWGTENDTPGDINTLAASWHTSFLNTCKTFIPNRTIKIRPMDKPWFTHTVKTSIRNRNRLYKRLCRTKRADHHADWKRSAMEANFAINLAKKKHQEKIKSLQIGRAHV
jgi:hypothetical protein